MPIVKKTNLGRVLSLKRTPAGSPIRFVPALTLSLTARAPSSLPFSPLERSFQENSPIAVDDMAGATDQRDTLVARIHEGFDFFFQASRIKNIVLGKELDEFPPGFQESLVPVVLLPQARFIHDDPDSGVGISPDDVGVLSVE